MQTGGIAPQFDLNCFVGGELVDVDAAAAAFECRFDGFDDAGFFGVAQTESVGHHVQHLARAGGRSHFAFGLHFGKTTGRQPLLDLSRAGVGRQLDRKGHHHPRVLGRHRPRQHLGVNALRGVVLNGLCSLAVIEMAQARKQQLEVIVQLGHGAHRRTRAAHGVGLVDGNGGGYALDLVHRRFVHAVQKLPRIGAESLDIPALAFGVQGVKHQTRFAGAAGPGHHGQLTGADVQIDVFEVVLTGAANANKTLGHGEGLLEWAPTF